MTSHLPWPTQPAKHDLRRQLDTEGIIVCPGVTNPLEARLAANVGFETIYATGAGIANVHFGVPDIGLLSMTEVLEVVRRITVGSRIPVIADIDTGFGGPLQVQRTVREFELAGVAGLQLEDQVNPKRCGHFDGTTVVETAEMVERITAAVEARQADATIIIARTDARASEGLAAALARSRAYVAAGADAIFLEAPRTTEELALIPKELPVPAVANMVEGGKTPFHSAPELEEMGYRFVIFANTVSRMSTAAARHGLQALHADGTSDAVIDDLLTWQERQELVGLAEYQLHEDELVARAAEIVAPT